MTEFATQQPMAPPPARIFSTQVVTAVTFLTGPLGGTCLLFLSLSRLGRKAEARRALALGGAVAAAQVLAATMLPYGTVSTLPFAAMLVMNTLSKRLLDPYAVPHFNQGGQRGSGWFVFGTCVVSAIAMVVLIGGAMLIKQSASRHVDVSPGHRVIYNKQAGEAEARKVGEILEAHGVFAPGQNAVVDYVRYRNNLSLEITLSGGWSTPETMKLYTEIAHEIATATKQRFVSIRLLDSGGRVKQKVEISRAAAP